MRTTLDIDRDVLQAAKDIAVASGLPAGKVLSNLAREALARPQTKREIVIANGFPVLKSQGGGVVGPEIVKRFLDQADFEDAGAASE